MFSRRDILVTGLATLSAPTLARGSSDAAASLGFAIEVPIDHDHPGRGRFALACEWGRAPRQDRPTVVLVADAQQFFIRPGGAARLQQDLFGDGCNVLSIIGRSRAPALEQLVLPAGVVDWSAARNLLNWRQWARDVVAVVHWLASRGHRPNLYGRSGGAHLIHQFLTLNPGFGGRAYVQAAVNHELDVRWGLSPDPFWRDFSAAEPRTARELLDYVRRHPERRRDLILVLQRQHFFEQQEDLPATRLAVARAFLDGDAARIAELRARYQVDAIEALRGSLEGVGSTVRIAEFAAPHEDPRRLADRLSPDVEAFFHYASPLVEAPPMPGNAVPPDWTRLREQSAEVLQVAARFDVTCDYRTQIGLHGMTHRSRLLLLDDNHVFRRWSNAGSQSRILQAFFLHGGESEAFRQAFAATQGLIWRES